MKTLRLLGAAFCVLASSVFANAAPLDVQVIPTSGGSMFANVVLFKGEKSAVLVDAPFTRADALRVIAEVLDSGKNLEAIIVTHDHPDHFFGLDAIADAFPQAKVVAHPMVVKDITRSAPIKFKRWVPVLGANAPHRPLIPTALVDDQVVIEGHALKIIGPMQGDHVHATAVWEPKGRTLVAGDLLFNGVHVWLAEHKSAQYAQWLASLDRLSALQPRRVIAGHTKPGLLDDSYSIDWTRQYLLAFRDAAAASKSSQQIAERMSALYPTTLDVVGGFILGTSSQVAAGEIAPWDE